MDIKSAIKTYILPIIELVVVVILAILLLRQCDRTNELDGFIEAYSDSITTYKDKNGQLTYKVQALEISSVGMLNYISSKDSSYNELKKLADLYKRKLDQTGDGVVIVNTVTELDTVTVLIPDSAGGRRFHYLDRWVSLSGLVTDSLRFDLSVDDDISVIQYTKKGKRYIDIKSASPYSTVKDIKSFTINEKPKRWGIGVQVGGGLLYDPFLQTIHIGPSISVGLNYNFIVF